MKKIHITEEQFKACLKEGYTQGGFTVNVKKGTSPSEIQAVGKALKPFGNTDFTTVDSNATSPENPEIAQGLAKDAGNNVNENEDFDVYTKKQLKEARRNKLVKESKKYFKKDFK